jgi:hypothetical protein
LVEPGAIRPESLAEQIFVKLEHIQGITPRRPEAKLSGFLEHRANSEDRTMLNRR